MQVMSAASMTPASAVYLRTYYCSRVRQFILNICRILQFNNSIKTNRPPRTSIVNCLTTSYNIFLQKYSESQSLHLRKYYFFYEKLLIRWHLFRVLPVESLDMLLLTIKPVTAILLTTFLYLIM